MTCWRYGYLSIQRDVNNFHMVQLMPLTPHQLTFIKIQNGVNILVPAYPGCLGKDAVKWVPVCLSNKFI